MVGSNATDNLSVSSLVLAHRLGSGMHVGCRDDEVSGRLVSLPRQAWSVDKTILCSIVYSFQKIGQTVLGSHWNGGIIIMVFDCAATDGLHDTKSSDSSNAHDYHWLFPSTVFLTNPLL